MPRVHEFTTLSGRGIADTENVSPGVWWLILFIFFFFEIPDVSKHCPVGGFRSVCVYTAPTCAPVILAPPMTESAHMSMHTREADWWLCP